jgi:hypothetical protein
LPVLCSGINNFLPPDKKKVGKTKRNCTN